MSEKYDWAPATIIGLQLYTQYMLSLVCQQEIAGEDGHWAEHTRCLNHMADDLSLGHWKS